jgi:hypothetical protein
MQPVCCACVRATSLGGGAGSETAKRRNGERAKGRKGDATMVAHARSGSKPARMSHRAIPSSARRVLRPTGQGHPHRIALSPTRRFASSPPLTISKKNG